MSLPTHCAICTHSCAATIDDDLIAGVRSTVIADGYGVGLRDLAQHKSQHLLKERGRPPRELVGQVRPAELRL